MGAKGGPVSPTREPRDTVIHQHIYSFPSVLTGGAATFSCPYRTSGKGDTTVTSGGCVYDARGEWRSMPRSVNGRASVNQSLRAASLSRAPPSEGEALPGLGGGSPQPDAAILAGQERRSRAPSHDGPRRDAPGSRSRSHAADRRDYRHVDAQFKPRPAPSLPRVPTCVRGTSARSTCPGHSNDTGAWNPLPSPTLHHYGARCFGSGVSGAGGCLSRYGFGDPGGIPRHRPSERHRRRGTSPSDTVYTVRSFGLTIAVAVNSGAREDRPPWAFLGRTDMWTVTSAAF